MLPRVQFSLPEMLSEDNSWFCGGCKQLRPVRRAQLLPPSELDEATDFRVKHEGICRLVRDCGRGDGSAVGDAMALGPLGLKKILLNGPFISVVGIGMVNVIPSAWGWLGWSQVLMSMASEGREMRFLGGCVLVCFAESGTVAGVGPCLGFFPEVFPRRDLLS